MVMKFFTLFRPTLFVSSKKPLDEICELGTVFRFQVLRLMETYLKVPSLF